jgi:RND family efflux transporter MFP subunit
MTTASSGAARGVKITAVAAGIGLFVFIGVRVKETIGDRKAIAATFEQRAKEGQKRAAVPTVRAKSRTWRASVPVTGTLAPVQEADIGFKTGGRLVKVSAKVGDQVKVGQVLASLDVAEARAQSAATSAARGAAPRAAVRAAQVSYDMARDAEKRTLALFQQHAVSDAENLAALNRSALALAQLEQARAQAQLAAVGVGNGALSAPFSGLVTKAPNGVGKIVGPGEPMFHVEDTQILKLSATLSEGDARLVAVGDEVAITSDGAGAVKGHVTAVLGSLDPQTRRVPMLAEIQNRETEPLLAGAFVRATVTSAREVRVLELPPTALRPGSQDEVVVLVDGRAHIAHLAFTTGEGGVLLVRSGITEKDDIVVGPSPEVREGDELGAR